MLYHPIFPQPRSSAKTFNVAAAISAAAEFCTSHPYKWNGTPCPASNSSPFSGPDLIGSSRGIGAAGGLGTQERIYLATRWSTGDCPVIKWFAGVDQSSMLGSTYLASKEFVTDCVTGFNLSITLCKHISERFVLVAIIFWGVRNFLLLTMTAGPFRDGKNSLGSLTTYKGMEFLTFESESALLDLTASMGPGCKLNSFKG